MSIYRARLRITPLMRYARNVRITGVLIYFTCKSRFSSNHW